MEEQSTQEDAKRLLTLFYIENRTEEQEAELNLLRQQSLEDQLKASDQAGD